MEKLTLNPDKPSVEQKFAAQCGWVFLEEVSHWLTFQKKTWNQEHMLKNKHEKEHFVCVKLRVTASNGRKSWKYKECEPHNCHNITRLYSGKQINYFLGH